MFHMCSQDENLAFKPARMFISEDEILNLPKCLSARMAQGVKVLVAKTD